MRFLSRIEAGDDCSMLVIPTYIWVPSERSKARRERLAELRKFLHGHERDRLEIVTATARFIPEVVLAIISVLKLGIGGSRLSCLDSSNELEVGVLDHALDNVQNHKSRCPGDCSACLITC